MVQHPGGPPGAAPPAEGPGDRSVAHQGSPGIAHRRMPAAGELHAAVDRYSLGDPRVVSPGGPTEAVDPRPPPRGTTWNPRTPVLQDGILQPDGQPQSEHGPRAGMVRETGGVRAPDDGDGRRPVGHRAGVRGEPRWPADDNLLGPRGPRLEDAAPAIHANVRRDGPRFPESGDGNGTRPPREGPAASRVPRHRGVGRARGRGARWEGDLLPRLRPEPCPPPS